MIEKITALNMNTITRAEFELLISENKKDLLDKFDKSKKEIIQMSDMIKKVVVHANENGWNDVYKIWNVGGFIVLSSLDLKTYLELLIISEDEIQRIALVRMIYTQLYEIPNDLNNLTNIRFMDAMKNINCADMIDEISKKRKPITQFRKQYEKELFSIRINIGAHREKDYKTFHDFLCEMNYTAAISLVFEFNNYLNDLAQTVQKIMNKTLDYVKSVYEKT